jgi:hypothetical protein
MENVSKNCEHVVSVLRDYSRADTSTVLNNTAKSIYLQNSGLFDETIYMSPDFYKLSSSFMAFLNTKNSEQLVSSSQALSESKRVALHTADISHKYFSAKSVSSQTSITIEAVREILNSDSKYRKSMLSNKKRGDIFFLKTKISPLEDFLNFLRDISAR